MLGIDISEQFIRVVSVRQRSNRFILREPLELAITEMDRQNPERLGQLLGQELRKRGWIRRKAVMTLPGRMCFVKRLPRDVIHQHLSKNEDHISRASMEALIAAGKQSLLIQSDDMVIDLWSKMHGFSEQQAGELRDPIILIGAADETTVDFCREICTISGIKIQSLELRPLAAVNGLIFNWQESQEDNIAIVYVDDDYADLAFYDSEGLVSLQSLSIANGHEVDGQKTNLLKQLPRAINTLRLSSTVGIPERIFIGGNSSSNGTLADVASELESILHIPVQACQAETGLTLTKYKEMDNEISNYVPAIGAALDGLEVSPTWFDFLHPRGKAREKTKSFSWRPIAFTIAFCLFICGAFWLSLVHQRKVHLESIQANINELQPELERINDAKTNWTLFQSFLPASEMGNRISYLRVLYEINELFPDTRDAYITELTISSVDDPVAGTTYSINITGRISQGDVLTEFIQNLNGSDLFQGAKQEGSRAVESSDPLYPVSFTVICNLRQMEVVTNGEN